MRPWTSKHCSSVAPHPSTQPRYRCARHRLPAQTSVHLRIHYPVIYPGSRSMLSQPHSTFPLIAVLLMGCSSSAPLTPNVDAEPPMDTCTCQAPALSNRLEFVDSTIDFLGVYGLAAACRNPDVLTIIGDLLGGSTVVDDGPSEDRALLHSLGPWWCDILPSDTCESIPPPHLVWRMGGNRSR